MGNHKNRRSQAQKSARPSHVTGKGAVNGRSESTRAFLMDGPRSTRVPSGASYKRKPKHTGRGWSDD